MQEGLEKKTYTSLEKVQELYNDLVHNNEKLDNICKHINEAEFKEDIESLEDLYQNEFMLYIDNVSIFDDLMNRLDDIEKNQDNEFELARIRKAAHKMLRVRIVDIL